MLQHRAYTDTHVHTYTHPLQFYLAVVVNRDLVHRSIGSFVPARWWTSARWDKSLKREKQTNVEANASSATLLDYQVCTYSIYPSSSHTFSLSLSLSYTLTRVSCKENSSKHLQKKLFDIFLSSNQHLQFSSPDLACSLLLFTYYSRTWRHTNARIHTPVVPNLIAHFTTIWSINRWVKENFALSKTND